MRPVRFDLMAGVQQIDFEDLGEETETRKGRNARDTAEGQVYVEDERRGRSVDVIPRSGKRGVIRGR